MLHAILRGRTACSLTHSRHATHTRTHDQRASLISSHSDTGINDLTELDVSENCAPALQPHRSCGSCGSCRAVPVPGQRSPRRRRRGLVRSAADRSCPVAQCFSTCVCVCVCVGGEHTHNSRTQCERRTRHVGTNVFEQLPCGHRRRRRGSSREKASRKGARTWLHTHTHIRIQSQVGHTHSKWSILYIQIIYATVSCHQYECV